MSMVIQWKQGSKFTGSAEPVHKRLETLRRQHGCLTAAIVKNDAEEHPKGPLHRHVIDCDRDLASERYYLERARNLIRSIEVIRTEQVTAPTPSYVQVTRVEFQKEPERKRIYTSTEEALADPVFRAEVLGRAIREAISYRKKYAALQELAGVIQAIDEFVEQAAV